MKISEYPLIEEITNDDVLVAATNKGTKKVPINRLKTFLADEIEVKTLLDDVPQIELSNTFVRCKNLGTELTEEQLEAIRARDFSDFYIGDYWEINGTTYRIAEVDPFKYARGSFGSDYTVLSKPTGVLLIMPDDKLAYGYWYTALQNQSLWSKGYLGSNLYSVMNSTVIPKIKNDFGEDSVLTMSYRIVSSYGSNGRASGGSKIQTQALLPYSFNLVMPANSEFSRRLDCFEITSPGQFKLFNADSSYAYIADNCWTLDSDPRKLTIP